MELIQERRDTVLHDDGCFIDICGCENGGGCPNND